MMAMRFKSKETTRYDNAGRGTAVWEEDHALVCDNCGHPLGEHHTTCRAGFMCPAELVEPNKYMPTERKTPRRSTVEGTWLPEKESTGGSVSYYSVRIESPTSGGDQYTAECNDVIEALQMNYAEGNAFKAIWRSCAARKLGNAKKDYPGAKYDAEKVVFFGKRMIEQSKEKNDVEQKTNSKQGHTQDNALSAGCVSDGGRVNGMCSLPG